MRSHLIQPILQAIMFGPTAAEAPRRLFWMIRSALSGSSTSRSFGWFRPGPGTRQLSWEVRDETIRGWTLAR